MSANHFADLDFFRVPTTIERCLHFVSRRTGQCQFAQVTRVQYCPRRGFDFALVKIACAICLVYVISVGVRRVRELLEEHREYRLVKAQQKYGKLAQMGTQQRSSAHTIEIVDKIHNGLIGRAYYAKAWYSNIRKSIGVGKEAPVPAQLDWDLWQGPAPRVAYKDNVQPYNWHWFKIWGTGETLNNGTHEIDVCRWALDVDYPRSISSSGGRYHFKDDWQFYDTLVTNFNYEDKMISWECKCCEGMRFYGRDRGSVIIGTTGSVLVDRDGYEIYDLKGNKTSEFKAGSVTSSTDLTGRDSMTDAHFANFIAGVRKGDKLNAPVSIGNVAVTMLQLSNVAWELGRELQLDSATGQPRNDPDAMKLWGRQYEKGWEPRV